MHEGGSNTERQNLSRRGFLAAGGAVSAGVLLAACGGNNGNGTSGSPGSSGSVKKGSTIKVWDSAYKGGQPNYDKAAEAIDAAFTKKYGVKVDHQAQPFADYNNLLQAAFTGHTGPDVMLLLPGAAGVVRWQPGLVNLTKAAAGLRDQLKFWDGTSPGYTDTSDTYGVPIGTVGIVAYYNKKMFRAAGLDPEQKPETFDDLMTMGAKIKAKGMVPFASGNKEGDENQWWFSFLWAGTHSVSDSIALARRQMKMTDDRIGTVLESYLQMQQAGLFSPTRFSTPLSPDGINSFSQGKGAMYLGLSDQIADWSTFDPILGEDNVGYFQPPAIGRSERGSLPVACSYTGSMPTFASNPAAAQAYVLYLGSTEAQQIQYDVGQLFPNNKNVNLPNATQQLAGLFKDYQSNPVYTDAHELLPGTVLTQYTLLCSEYLQGRTSLKTMLSQLQTTNEQAH